MRKCAQKCLEYKVDCPNSDCRLWIDYPQELNCSLISIEMNDSETGILSLREVAKRMNLCWTRIHQIETEALKKFTENMKNIYIET